MRYRLLFGLPMIAALLTGCDDDKETNDDPGHGSILDGYGPMELTPGNIRALAGSSSPNIFTIGIIIAAVPSLQNDPNCPVVTATPSETTYEGGCTTMDGTNVVGRAVMHQTADGDGTIDYQGWGFGENTDCKGAPVENLVTYTGAMNYDKTAPGAGSFTLEVQVDAKAADPQSCATFESTAAYDYAGSFIGTEKTDGSIDLQQKTTWQGSGQLGIALLGKADLKTEDEVIESSVCDTEAASGSTTISSLGDTAVILYDGATDCDMDSTVTWTLNGVPQGELTAVRCSLALSPSRGGHGAFACLAIALACFLRRRRPGQHALL